RIVQRGVASREPRDDELPDLLADREAGEQRVDGNRRDGGRVTGDGFGGPSDCLTAGTSQHGGNDQEPMRSHSFSLFVLIACAFCPSARVGAQVRPGIEVLLTDSIHVVAGKRVALLTNQTGVDRLGRRDVDLLRSTAGVELRLLFSPEHGFRGVEDRPGLPDGVDSATGLPIYSLYGGTPLSDVAALDSTDVVLVDLQDIGARYRSEERRVGKAS